MKRIVCYCLAISMIPLHRSSELSCTEPQLFVQTYCGNDTITNLTIYNTNKDNHLKETDLTYDGCPIDFDGLLYLNNTFYIECETENIDCLEEREKVRNETYHLECEEFDEVTVEGAIEWDLKGVDEEQTVDEANELELKEAEEYPSGSVNVETVLASSVGGLAATVGLAYGVYKLKSCLQAGSYIIPESPPSPGFIELA